MLADLLRRPSPAAPVRSFTLEQLGLGWAFAASASGAAPRSVTVDEAMRNDAAYSCIDVLASTVSTVPFDLVRYDGADRLPFTVAPLLLAEPSNLVDPDVWLYQGMFEQLTDGNAFGVVTATDALSTPTKIEWVASHCVTERKVVDNIKVAKVDGTLMRAWPFGDLFHVPGKTLAAGSPYALSPLQFAATSIKSALEAEGFGFEFFADGGHPTGIIYSDEEMTRGQSEQLSESIWLSWRRRRRLAVLGSGLKYEQNQINPSDSQFIELQRFVVEKMARYYRVPPSMIYGAVSGQSVTYANVSQADLNYLKHSVDAYLVRWERALSRLFGNRDVVKANRNAFLRADVETRNKVYDLRLKNKTMAVNEVRAAEDEPPFEDDAYNQPGVPDGTIDDKTRSVTEMLQKVYLAVDKVVTADEAREIVNRAGAGLTIPGPFQPADAPAAVPAPQPEAVAP